MKRLLPLLFLALCTCTPAQLAGLQTANTIANGVACGMAAANGTPCTPQAVLDALARDAAALQSAKEAQRVKVDAVAPQAAAVDPVTAKAILDQLAANARTEAALTEGQRRLTEALVVLAARVPPEPAPLPDKAPRDEPADAGAPDAADGGL